MVQRWCSDGFEFTCWNGDIVRSAFIIDAHDREIIAWCAAARAGISGSDVRDMMLAAVDARFGGHRAPHQVEMLSRQSIALHRQVHPHLRPAAWPENLLYASEKPAK
ncbi:MAG: transposase InsO family protein [Paracoccaceae bacterium]|jgi:transposase InsO family protein